jgi:hypothetical protein
LPGENTLAYFVRVLTTTKENFVALVAGIQISRRKYFFGVKNKFPSRVTRLGDFSPVGLLKITFWATFYQTKFVSHFQINKQFQNMVC